MGASKCQPPTRHAQVKAVSAAAAAEASSEVDTDSQPSYSTDSAAMQHSTFNLQGVKPASSAQHEATSPAAAHKVQASDTDYNVASQTLHGIKPETAAEMKDAKEMTNEQPRIGAGSSQRSHQHGTKHNPPPAVADAAPGHDADEAEVEGGNAQQGQSASASQPEKAFGDMELIEQVAVPELVQSAEQAKIGWGRVKGYPSWPAQVMTDKAAQPRLSHARKASAKALPVMFFGTLEVAWLPEKDMLTWSQGLEGKLWDKGKKREAFVLAVQQVCNFVRVQALRSAPKDWWCKPAALPAAARKLQQATAATTSTARVTTPRPTSAAAKRMQAHKPACTTAKLKASAKPSIDSTATPSGDPKTAALAQVRPPPATAPAALKQAGKRKHAATATKQAKKVMKARQEPDQQQEAKLLITEMADQAPATAPEQAVIQEASVLPSSSVTASMSGIPSVTASDAVVQDTAAPRTEVLPAVLQVQVAGAAVGGVPPNKRAKTAAGKAGSGQDASGVSAFTARALSELMNDDVLTEALQDLLIAIGVTLPSQHPMQGASTASAIQLGNAAGHSAVAPHSADTMAQTINSDAQHNSLHPAGSNSGPGHDSAEAIAAATHTIKPEDRAPTAAVATVAAAETAPASAAVSPAAAAPAGTAMGPPTGAPDHQDMSSTDAVATASAPSAAGPLSKSAMPAPAAQPDSAPAQHANAEKHTGSKRLRGKASVLAKALGLNKSRAVKQHVKCAQQGPDANIKAGEPAAVCPALQRALADLGLTSQQLHRIDTQLVKELLHAKQAGVTTKNLSAAAMQGLQDVKAALQAASMQRHHPLQAASAQQAPLSHPTTALPSQPASQANIPQQLASSQSNYLRDRAPSYVHIPRNVYARGMARPKRQPKDDIPVCNCTLPRQGGLLATLPARQPTQRQASSSQYKQMAQQAAVGRAMLTNATDQSVTCGEDQQVSLGDVQSGAERSTDAAAAADALPQLVQACGEECLNRLSYIRCDAKLCPCSVACSNRPFHELQSPQVEVFLTENRGWGVKAAQPITKGTFVVEYAGEVISHGECERRMQVAKQKGEPHFYMMELRPGLIIDARDKGNVARLINSSCAPNCESQKWHDAATGETRVGIFALRDIPGGEELSYDYQFQHSGLMQAAGAYRCMCGATTCRGTMDSQPERLKDFGKRIEVWWEGDNVFYRGTIVGYSMNAHKHTVLYDDNETEKVSLDTTPHRWLDENASPHPSPLQPVADAQGNWQLPPLTAPQNPVGKVGTRGKPAAKPSSKKQARKRKRSSGVLQPQAPPANTAVAPPVIPQPLVPKPEQPPIAAAPAVSAATNVTAAAAPTAVVNPFINLVQQQHHTQQLVIPSPDKLSGHVPAQPAPLQQHQQSLQPRAEVSPLAASGSQQQQQQQQQQPHGNAHLHFGVVDAATPSQPSLQSLSGHMQLDGHADTPGHVKLDQPVLPHMANDTAMAEAETTPAEEADCALDTAKQQRPDATGIAPHQPLPASTIAVLDDQVVSPGHLFTPQSATQTLATAQDMQLPVKTLATGGTSLEPELKLSSTEGEDVADPHLAAHSQPRAVGEELPSMHLGTGQLAPTCVPIQAGEVDPEAQGRNGMLPADAAAFATGVATYTAAATTISSPIAADPKGHSTPAPAATAPPAAIACSDAPVIPAPDLRTTDAPVAAATAAVMPAVGTLRADAAAAGLHAAAAAGLHAAAAAGLHAAAAAVAAAAAAPADQKMLHSAANCFTLEASGQAERNDLQMTSHTGQTAADPANIQEHGGEASFGCLPAATMPMPQDVNHNSPSGVDVVRPKHEHSNNMQQFCPQHASTYEGGSGALQGEVVISKQPAFKGLVAYADSDLE